ncbi:hypothetical protein AC578_4349 [Pseudocercospora eumusae]|uniref:Uncharacterized protein n=1 Tax=Pseudocercospora eumusae TaxID=321146 RepID=A0A139H5M9_9PEZI|nr:hypothetical protein AC578_4349 [Pseudocercospora eumusae]
MGQSKKAKEQELAQYLQAFAGLTINQLKSQATDEPDGKFKFGSNEKVLALRHAVKYVYTDKVPPTLDVFLDLVTNVIPVPVQHGLDAAEACMEGVRRLITHVIEVATKQRLIHSDDSGNGVWVVHVSNHLIGWDGTGGWKAIKTPSLFANGPVQRNEFASYQKILPDVTSDESWATIIRNAMHQFASTRSQATPLSNNANIMSPPRVAKSTALTIANPPATSSTYQPSSFTDQSAQEQHNQMIAHEAFTRYLFRHNRETRVAGVQPPQHVLKSFYWNEEGPGKLPGHDYVHWALQMLTEGHLTAEDFQGPLPAVEGE